VITTNKQKLGEPQHKTSHGHWHGQFQALAQGNIKLHNLNICISNLKLQLQESNIPYILSPQPGVQKGALT
jgi:hypothetical protein